ncbi:hypothetical protein HanPSC8_Chr17g0794721 [Helianthus annuus]|nr:hypothetical protein HanPSC8_Chr17g0794721 [Helianthus annuus]
MGMVVSPLVLPHLHRSPLKTRGCYPYRHQLSALKRSPAYADSDSEETVDSDPHESQLAGDGIGDDGGMR